MTVSDFVHPGGAQLVDLRVDEDRAAELKARAVGWQSWTLTLRQLCDLELLTCGAFAPLTTFLGEQD
jgi:sulfate adenylyltransferase